MYELKEGWLHLGWEFIVYLGRCILKCVPGIEDPLGPLGRRQNTFRKKPLKVILSVIDQTIRCPVLQFRFPSGVEPSEIPNDTSKNSSIGRRDIKFALSPL